MIDAVDWRAYYRAAHDRPPRPTLLRALDGFAAEGRGPSLLAADIGCGNGRDALVLLRAGWRVWALDAEAAALEALRQRAAAEALAGLEVVQGRFENTAPPGCHLVNASFVLFACPPRLFMAAWARLLMALLPGGRFAGQFLGPADSWATKRETTILDRSALERLLDGLEVENLEEEETDARTPLGEAKHWHIWHVNARRPL